MAIGILIGCILLALLSTAWAIYTHMQALCLTNRLENMLRRAEDGSFEESAFDESRLSKLETMLYHYLLRGATSQRVIQEEKDKIKSLISDISHQTKTPLANIRLYAELLGENDDLPAEVADLVNQVRFQSEKLNFLVQALVKTSRLENGIIALTPRMQNLSPMLEELYQIYLPVAQQKGVCLKYRREKQCMAVLDRKWTMEAVGNILDNAIKYTPPDGVVTLSVRNFEVFVCIDVTDTGIGILESEIPKLFERFYRSPGVNQVQGVGIGLYLAREIVARQGGYIRVDSTPQKGSTFHVFLKMEQLG